MNYIEAIRNRRSVYQIGNQLSVSQKEIETLISEVLNNAPSPMNVQSDRVVLLFNNNHKKLWEIVLNTLKQIVPSESFEPTQKRIESFAAGFGTVLFFQDTNLVKELENKMPKFKENVLEWTIQSNAMLQFAVWTGLESLGLGASLQHYNPIIDADVFKEFNLPSNWKLKAQMPFGNIVNKPKNKEVLPLSEKLIIKQ